MYNMQQQQNGLVGSTAVTLQNALLASSVLRTWGSRSWRPGSPGSGVLDGGPASATTCCVTWRRPNLPRPLGPICEMRKSQSGWETRQTS